MGILRDKALPRGVLKISAPVVGGLSSQMVVSVVDTSMVGRLGNTTVVLAAIICSFSECRVCRGWA